MLQEYAVDPQIAADYSNLRALSLLFDYSNLRRISEFPLMWARVVIEHAQKISPTNEKYVEILLTHMLRESACIRSFGRSYNDSFNWKKNAESQHKTKPFQAIICDDGIDFIPSNEIHAANTNLAAAHTWQLAKSYTNLSNLLLPIMAQAKNIYLIDPYYSPYNVAYTKLFSSCLGSLNARTDAAAITLAVCTSFDRPKAVYSAGEEARLVSDLTTNYIPNPLRIKLIGSLKEGMHARYLITDIASFIIDHSFDVKDSAVANITMISAAEADAIKKQYFPGP